MAAVRRGTTVRIMALPAFRNRALNPYNALLYAAMSRLGLRVEEVSPWNVLVRRHDVIHIHWPEYLFDAPGLGRALAKAAAAALVLTALRLRKTCIVWTIHNLRGHDVWHTRLSASMWRWFVRRVDGYIALTPAGRAVALEHFPDLCRRPGFVIPHGDYRGAYPDSVTREIARAVLGVPAQARVVAFVGAIRPYKNLPGLLAAFRRVPDADWRLLVAGRATPADLAADLDRVRAGDPRILLNLGLVPPDRVQLYLRAADLLVFPYRDVLNSGSALLALSFDRPVLVPDRGALAELREAAGPDWVRTYDGDLDAATLVDGMTWATTTPREIFHPGHGWDWDTIAHKTLCAYETVTTARRAASLLQRGATR